jgi:7,8-dihydro-6-hydroxymethylpterin-pyrophosphokinase
VISRLENCLEGVRTLRLEGEGNRTVYRVSWEFTSFTDIAKFVVEVRTWLEARKFLSSHEVVERSLSRYSGVNVRNIDILRGCIEISSNNFLALERATILGGDINN